MIKPLLRGNASSDVLPFSGLVECLKPSWNLIRWRIFESALVLASRKRGRQVLAKEVFKTHFLEAIQYIGE